MLQSTVVLFVIALIAGALGFADMAGMLSDVASVLLLTFVVVFVTRDLLERTRDKQAPRDSGSARGRSAVARKR